MSYFKNKIGSISEKPLSDHLLLSIDDWIVFFGIQSYPVLKNDIPFRSKSCFGWNQTTCIQKLSKSVLWCTTWIFVLM